MNRIIAAAFMATVVFSAPAFAFPDAGDKDLAASARNVFEVPYSDAEEAVARALNQKGVGDKLAVTITGQRSKALFAYEKPVSVEVKGLQLDKRDSHWSASLLFVADNEVISAIPASGRYEELVEVPVLKREVRNGDVITAADVEIRDFTLAHTRNDTITDMSWLIGKSPLHSISPSRPIRTHEVSNPAVIKKNASVEIRYNSPGMVITTSGQALNDGAKGDVIDVRNTNSKKIVRAVVFDSTTVQITSPGTEVSESTGVGYATTN